jgi:biotin synthase
MPQPNSTSSKLAIRPASIARLAREARALAEVGLTAIYHAIRLREGEGTCIDPNERKRTIKSALDAGLSALFCLEPVGPEHAEEELVKLMFVGKQASWK